MKTCKTCKVEKGNDQFYEGGSRCKDCERARARAYQAANPEAARERRREFNRRHPEKSAEYMKRWRQRHPEKWHAIQRRAVNKKRRYRTVAAEMLGRPLARGETVHHINCDDQDHAPENLHVFPSRKEHQVAHGSLNRLVKALLERGTIRFSREAGQYEFAVPGADSTPSHPRVS